MFELYYLRPNIPLGRMNHLTLALRESSGHGKINPNASSKTDFFLHAIHLDWKSFHFYFIVR